MPVNEINRVFRALRTLPPQVILSRLERSIRARLHRWQADRGSRGVSDAGFRKALIPEIAGEQDLLHWMRETPQPKFFISPAERTSILDAFHKLCPGADKQVIQAADRVLRHEFDLLGSGAVSLGTSIPWHMDFVHQHEWSPELFYMDAKPAPAPGGYDIKVPWELSRCQHFAWLGQAYWLTGDEKYSHEFRDEVKDWIQRNPLERGVNWACTMDVALRVVNWLWGYAFFRDSSELDEAFHLAFHRSLLEHGRFIMENLEWSAQLTGNHYLSDIVGLIYLGTLLPMFREASHWLEFGLQELEKEMLKQVYPDGVDFEASTNYHRLSAELFFSATLLAELNGHGFSSTYLERLERMLGVISLVMHPDGSMPILGDQDNGRVHRLKVFTDPVREWLNFRPLLAAGALWMQRGDWATYCDGNWEEAVWLFGVRALDLYNKGSSVKHTPKTSLALPDGGWYVLQDQDFHVVVEAGRNGQNGMGGHAHNDTLSFALAFKGFPVVIDPGTGVYTADFGQRNLFRSTRMHNTVSIEGFEQNRIDPDVLFAMGDDARLKILDWTTGLEYSRFTAELRPAQPSGTVHRRTLHLDHKNNYLLLMDQVSAAAGERNIQFHFAPEVKLISLDKPLPGLRLEIPDTGSLLLFAINPGGTWTLGQGQVSRGYGSFTPCQTAVFSWKGESVQRLLWVDEVGFDHKWSLIQAQIP